MANKQQKYSEVDAMGDVDLALSKVEPESQQRILDWATSKYHVARMALPGSPVESRKAETAKPTPSGIKGFVAQKRPDGFYERISCLAYHLEKFQGKTEVTRQDIIQANSDARMSKMSNPSVFIKHTTHTYGYLTSLGKRKFALSARGEALVDALPDRTKVEEALEANPFRNRARKKRSKK